ncbi:PLP-dependent aminotransferase family protein [Brevibacillus sp. SYP-B805]|uniref:MocR-like pyridoxine biosynthesis transcription factor PdxR n=1 Tax=Brevibacillus sp. SYP-B805 TaxID=1578199 RepID=UPI0013EB9423|nr:PLP-dependent aminotransferase family protein [Brevibacillus sp. SYP-B805]NGQ94483.1 PLP-dependent aminotransferase family protein [Brevibacillus sp. SYP-B805]
MEWNPIRSKDYPLYKQIADYMARRIAAGEFPAGSHLPSERTLAKELQVNRSTVVAAYEELYAAGIVEKRKGSGTIVSADIWGMPRKRLPNWRRYVEQGSFLPNLPLIRHIQKESKEADIIDFASGELSPDLFPLEQFRSILAQQTFDCHLGYEDPQGNLALRETIARHVKTDKGIEATPSSILITSGSQQALHLIVQCLLKPGDAVAIEDPSYTYSLPIFQSAGLKTFLLPVGRTGINPDDLTLLHQKHRIRMVFLNPTYQNPTGTAMPLEQRRKILALSAELGIPVIEDDPYTLLSFTGERLPTLKSLDRHGTVLYISSLTKIAASGLRIGWVIGPQPVIERLADAKQQIDFGHSIFPEWIAQRFLASPEFSAHLDRLVGELKQKRDLLVDSLERHLSGIVEFHVPAGGIHLWCKLLKETNDLQLLREAIRHGVVYVPGRVMGTQQGFVRFTFARAEKERIDAGIRRFAEAYRG